MKNPSNNEPNVCFTHIIMSLLTRMIQAQADEQPHVFSLLRRPPGPLVPGEVGSVGFHPGLGGPLLRDVIAPT